MEDTFQNPHILCLENLEFCCDIMTGLKTKLNFVIQNMSSFSKIAILGEIAQVEYCESGFNLKIAWDHPPA